MTQIKRNGEIIEVDDTMVIFAERVMQRMDELHISRKVLSELLGCHPNTLHNILNFRSETGVCTLARLSVILKTSPDWLLGFES